nr:hypothetical protein [uncultured Draconibacterium sp.]
MKGRIIVKNTANCIKAIQRQASQADELTIKVLKYVGENFVREARLNREFIDDTGNLQSSIGYVIVKNRKIIWQAIKGIGTNSTAEGKEAGERLAEAIAITLPDGFALVGVAGMEYGIYVEAMGIEVISGSVPETRKLLKEIFKELK